MLCRKDEEGNTFFKNLHLKPFHVPIRQVGRTIHEYEGKESGPVYDPELGWALRPDVYHHNSQGFISKNPSPERLPSSPTKLRVALIGDSYTQGDFETGWWRVLEDTLENKGIEAEVFNFGVGGYGLDQSYLRWSRDSKPWKPEIVILGFMADVCSRNLNLMRLLRDPGSGIPFMKPRFLLNGQNGLELANSPTPQPGQLMEILSHLDSWPLIKYEHFYSPMDYQSTPWRWSRLTSVIEAELTNAREGSASEAFFDPSGEAGQISMRLLEKMKKEVETSGASFYILILPTEGDLELIQSEGRTKQAKLIDAIQGRFETISMESPLAEFSKGKNLDDFFCDSHYKAEFNQVVGAGLAEFLAPKIHHPKK